MSKGEAGLRRRRFAGGLLAGGAQITAMAGWAGLAGPAAAMAVAGAEVKAEPGSRQTPAVPAAERPTLSLVDGRIEAVDAAGRWVQLRGQQVALHPTALRVLGPQGLLSRGVADLRPGQAVRFALEALPPSASVAQVLANQGRQRIVLILLESRP